MDLVVTTPGVSTDILRPALESESGERLLVIDRATRCGSTTVDPTGASRLRLAVAPCAVSLHAGDRVRDRFLGSHSVDAIIVCRESCGLPSDGQLEARFDCPVSVHVVSEESDCGLRYCKR